MTDLQEIIGASISERVPGLSAAVARKGEIVWTGAAGYCDLQAKRPMSPAAPMGIGSITKTFVATVVLQLLEENLLSLEDTVEPFLGEAVRAVPNRTATIQQLLSHTSGIPSWEDDSEWIARARGGLIEPGRLWTPNESLMFIENRSPTSFPGAAYAYSNTNYTLLGLIIEAIVSGSAVSEIRRRIISPLNLRSAYVEGFEPAGAGPLLRRYHLATTAFQATAGKAASFREVTPDLWDVSEANLSAEWLAGGLVMTAADLAMFGSGLLRKSLGPRTLPRMKMWRALSLHREVGLGLFRCRRANGRALIGHDGAVLGFSACFYWIEGTQIVVATLSNCGSIHSGPDAPAELFVGRSPRFVDAVLHEFS